MSSSSASTVISVGVVLDLERLEGRGVESATPRWAPLRLGSDPTARATARAPRRAGAARSPTSASTRSRGRRAVGGRARSPGSQPPASNQWNASPTKTASTLASSSGIASALPATASPCSARIRSSGSTATTCSKRPYELPGHAARSGPQVEHARLGVELEHLLGAVEQHPRIRGPDAVVGLGDVAEAEAELVSQLRRAERLGSLSAFRARSRVAGSGSCPRRSA